eukprot:Sdes_comp9035_c0_seq1m463
MENKNSFNFLSDGGENHNGQRVLVCHASRLPATLASCQSQVMQYLQNWLEEFAHKEYVIVYFHAGLELTLSPLFLRDIYDTIQREYRKNMKAVYLVHPTDTLSALIAVVKPFVSSKVWDKVVFVPNLTKLREYVILERLQYDKIVRKEDICRKWSWNGYGL